MKTITKTLLTSATLVLSAQTTANDSFTFGLGAGAFYSGVGVNAGIQSTSDLK